eukprot:gene5466-6982_t
MKALDYDPKLSLIFDKQTITFITSRTANNNMIILGVALSRTECAEDVGFLFQLATEPAKEDGSGGVVGPLNVEMLSLFWKARSSLTEEAFDLAMFKLSKYKTTKDKTLGARAAAYLRSVPDHWQLYKVHESQEDLRVYLMRSNNIVESVCAWAGPARDESTYYCLRILWKAITDLNS